MTVVCILPSIFFLACAFLFHGTSFSHSFSIIAIHYYYYYIILDSSRDRTRFDDD